MYVPIGGIEQYLEMSAAFTILRNGLRVDAK